MPPNVSTETVVLSFWGFAAWWVLILGVHVISCVYAALYSYSYWKLKDSFLDMFLESLKIGMLAPYHHRIAIIHAMVSGVHAVCIFLMIGGSVWQRSLAFTPWTSTLAGSSNDSKPLRTNSAILKKMSTIYTKLADRRSLFGVNSEYFHVILICREVVETALQTVQAYRMSRLLPRTILNRFYVVLLAINCWSSVFVYSMFFKGDEAKRRFACIVLDCILDVMSCMGVEFIILMSYASQYNPKLRGFSEWLWYNDEWVARALNEFQMLVVVSWSDLASRTFFSLGLVMTTTSIKDLLQHHPRNINQVAIGGGPTSELISGEKLASIVWPKPALALGPSVSMAKLLAKPSNSYSTSRLKTQLGQWLLRAAHLTFGAWGVLVLAFHTYASLQPTLPQCFMQVRPWATSRPACYLAALDCHTLGISGKKLEVEQKWNEFDSSTVVQLLIRHCPALEVPDVFTEFHQLRGIKVYNSTIKEWGESAAFTNTHHPGLGALFIVRVNMTDGLLPLGFQSSDFPKILYDIEMCATNIREIPDDLDTKWSPASIIQIEYSQLTSIPSVLWRLEPYYLAVTGNPITEVPPEVFESPGMFYLGISEMNIQELPRNVTRLSPDLGYIYIGETNIAVFWSWVDELLENRKGKPAPWLGERSAYCYDLEKLQNGSADSFSVPMSSEYSTVLMDPSEENRKVILKEVRCDVSIDGLFYPIAIDDGNNAISTPPPLVKP